MTDPYYPLTVGEVPSLGGHALASLAGLLAGQFGLDGDVGEVLGRAGVSDPDRLLVGMVRQFDRPGQVVFGRHMDGLHGTVVLPDGCAVVCMRCVIDYMLDGAVCLSPRTEDHISRLVAEACIARPTCPSAVIPLVVLEPLVNRAVELRDPSTG